MSEMYEPTLRMPGYPATEPKVSGLSTFYLEVSWGGQWYNLNDSVRYKAGAETLTGSQVVWRKVMAASPVAEGNYLVHAVKDLQNEQLQVYVHGQSQNDLNENVYRIEQLFSQLDYRIRLTFDDYREYWRCQPADWTLSRNQTLTHNTMAVFDLTVPRFPTVTREMIG